MADFGRWANTGLLLMRVGLGASFFMHGLGKFMGGEATLTAVGSAVGNLGITDGYYAFGVAAALTETLGGVLVVLGLLFRPACLLLVGVLSTALLMHVKKGDNFLAYSHALELLIVFVGLFFIGPGAYALGGKRKSKPAPSPKTKSSDK